MGVVYACIDRRKEKDSMGTITLDPMACKLKLDKPNLVYRIWGRFIFVENWNENHTNIGIKDHEKV
jgi:hypothetical protein